MEKLFLLDAYALIYRAYYAFIRAPRINSKGQNTSAIFGFVNTLEDVLKKEQPTHIGVAFDPRDPPSDMSCMSHTRRSARRHPRTSAPAYPSSRISCVPTAYPYSR